MGGLGDRIQQSEQVYIALACAFCGQSAGADHSCPEKEKAEDTQNGGSLNE